MVAKNSKQHNKADHDDLYTSTIALIGFLSAILLFVLIVGMQVMYFSFEQSEISSKILSEKPAEFTQVITQQQEKLNAYRWINEASGVVSIPIDRAMDLVVRENQ